MSVCNLPFAPDARERRNRGADGTPKERCLPIGSNEQLAPSKTGDSISPALTVEIADARVASLPSCRGRALLHPTKAPLDATDRSARLANKPKCSGVVGMFARSYLGTSQYLQICRKPANDDLIR